MPCLLGICCGLCLLAGSLARAPLRCVGGLCLQAARVPQPGCLIPWPCMSRSGCKSLVCCKLRCWSLLCFDFFAIRQQKCKQVLPCSNGT